MGSAKFRAAELLFRPDLIGEECEGIHEVLTYAIQKADMDLRRTLFANIVLSGGSTLFKGDPRLLFIYYYFFLLLFFFTIFFYSPNRQSFFEFKTGVILCAAFN